MAEQKYLIVYLEPDHLSLVRIMCGQNFKVKSNKKIMFMSGHVPVYSKYSKYGSAIGSQVVKVKRVTDR